VTLRQQMLQAARRAPSMLGESTRRVAHFVLGHRSADGGFQGRGEASDLYYTLFGIESLAALGAELPPEPMAGYLAGFGGGEGLDLVHLCSLARCWAALPDRCPAQGAAAEMLRRLERFRTPDGGYAGAAGAAHGTAYGAFLALGAHHDLASTPPTPDRLVASVEALHAADGSFANEPAHAVGSTSATAAAVVVLSHLGRPLCVCVADWLLARHHAHGGFAAGPEAPMPDLLSTATSLHALACLGVSLEPVAEPCLDFLDSLWDSRGGFHATWADDALDCEYAFYGLLALGHLSA